MIWSYPALAIHNAAGMGGEPDEQFTSQRVPRVLPGCDGRVSLAHFCLIVLSVYIPNLIVETAYSQSFAGAQTKIHLLASSWSRYCNHF